MQYINVPIFYLYLVHQKVDLLLSLLTDIGHLFFVIFGQCLKCVLQVLALCNDDRIRYIVTYLDIKSKKCAKLYLKLYPIFEKCSNIGKNRHYIPLLVRKRSAVRICLTAPKTHRKMCLFYYNFIFVVKTTACYKYYSIMQT